MIRNTTPETLDGYLDEYILTRAVTFEAARQYRIAVKIFDAWAGSTVRFDAIDHRMLSLFVADYGARVKPATLRSKRSMLLSLVRAAIDDGYCDPAALARRVRPVRAAWIPPTCWDFAEVGRLLDACKGLPRNHECGIRRAAWFDLAVRIAWDTGLRWSDQVCRLRVDQITPEGFVAHSQHKTGRVVVRRLSGTTLRALYATLETAPRELCTPWSRSHETFHRQFGLLVEKSGIRAGTWKWLRRAGSTDCELQMPGAGAQHLGHAPGSQIAERHYLDPAILARRSVSPRELA